jgi:hypothetical protein
MGGERKLTKFLVGKPMGKIPLGRPWVRWEDGIRTDLREIVWRVWSGFDWLRIGPMASFCEYGVEPSDCGATKLVS